MAACTGVLVYRAGVAGATDPYVRRDQHWGFCCGKVAASQNTAPGGARGQRLRKPGKPTKVWHGPRRRLWLAYASRSRAWPVTVTVVSTGPLDGEKLEMATLDALVLVVTSSSPPMKAVVAVLSPLPVVTACSATRWLSPS